MSVSSVGSLMLIRDILEYQLISKEFRIPEVEDMFETLQRIGNLFAVPASSIPNLVADDPKLSRMDPSELLQFVKLRADFKSIKLNKLS